MVWSTAAAPLGVVDQRERRAVTRSVGPSTSRLATLRHRATGIVAGAVMLAILSSPLLALAALGWALAWLLGLL